jgi:hypothetical protein
VYSFEALTVHEALQYSIEYLLHTGVEEQSRFGPVIAVPHPVCIEFLNPRERVLYPVSRDANCFFHFFEALWMLSGDNDIEFPGYFNSAYAQFSDDGGKTMWDAYGWRWRAFFGWDQIEAIVAELRAKPESRRCVLSMWNSAPSQGTPGKDAGALPYLVLDGHAAASDDFYVATHGGKAVPCNTHAYVDTRGGRLNLTVLNRSNDLMLGMLGANIVHMSFLAEYLAMRIGVPLGVYRQFTNNMHSYIAKYSREQLGVIASECAELLDGEPLPAMGPALEPGFDEDLALFMPWARLVIQQSALKWEEAEAWENPPALKTQFMDEVALPMFLAWYFRKQKCEAEMWQCLNDLEVTAPDWGRACREWVLRRKK